MIMNLKIGITCFPTYGGSGVVATELGKQLADRGHEIHFVSSALPFRLDRFHERIFFHEVDVVPYPLFQYPPYDLALATKMMEVAVSAKLDLFHVHYALPHAVSAYLAKSMIEDRDVKFITTLHGTDIALIGADKAYFPVTRFGIQKSDGVTAVSRYLQQLTIELVGRAEVEVIHNFVDTNYFRSLPVGDCARRSFAPHGEAVLLHISNFRPVKRILDVVRIFEKVQSKLPARLVFVGDGPERASAENYIRDAGIEKKVLFLGRQDDVPELLCCADVLLLPSELESFGLVALEAMSCQVPVVATNVGGLPEVIAHGETGYLSALGNVDEMADYALEILKNPGLKHKLGIAGRQRALDLFEQSRIVPLYEKYYEKVLAR
jgi:N-acetyl-alpha-D-glucosaminyl L-malate synthase BshA